MPLRRRPQPVFPPQHPFEVLPASPPPVPKMSVRRRISTIFGNNRSERRGHERSQSNGYPANGFSFPPLDEEITTPPNHSGQRSSQPAYEPVPQRRSANIRATNAMANNPNRQSHARFSNLPFRERQQAPVRKMTKENLRDLCEMIKEKNHLDHVIWGLRNCREPDRKRVEMKMRTADGLMAKIQKIVKLYDNPSAFEKDADYKKFKEIRKLIELPGKRHWMTNPPWNG